MLETANGEGIGWIRVAIVCTIANTILVSILCAAFFLGGFRSGASPSGGSASEADLGGSEATVAESGQDLSVEYLRTLKPKIDSSAAAIQSVEQSVAGLTRKIDVLQSQVQGLAYVVRGLQKQSTDAEHRTELLTGFLDRILKSLDAATQERQAISEQLNAMRMRQLARDLHDIKRAVERGRTANAPARGSKELTETISQLSAQTDNLLQEMAEIKSYLAQIQKIQSDKEKEQKELHQFIKKYMPILQDLPTENSPQRP